MRSADRVGSHISERLRSEKVGFHGLACAGVANGEGRDNVRNVDESGMHSGLECQGHRCDIASGNCDPAGRGEEFSLGASQGLSCMDEFRHAVGPCGAKLSPVILRPVFGLDEAMIGCAVQHEGAVPAGIEFFGERGGVPVWQCENHEVVAGECFDRGLLDLKLGKRANLGVEFTEESARA